MPGQKGTSLALVTVFLFAFVCLETVCADHHAMHSPSENDKDNSFADFCAGMPMTMFMDGFHWSLLTRLGISNENGDAMSESHESQQQQQQQQHPKQFRGAMVFSFLLAIIMEAISALRGWIVQTQAPNSPLRKTLLVIIYACQSLLGYVIMIVAMMYSLELLFSVAAGLAVGHLLFVRILPVPGIAAVHRQHND